MTLKPISLNREDYHTSIPQLTQLLNALVQENNKLAEKVKDLEKRVKDLET